MKLRMTGYKTMAPPTATRIEPLTVTNLESLLDAALPEPPDNKDEMLIQLITFVASVKHAYSAIYFWVE